MATLIVKLRHKEDPINITRHVFTDIDLQTSVKELKTQIAQFFEVPVETLKPIFCGNALRDDQSLDSYGITSGTFINVFQQEPPLVSAPEYNLPVPSPRELTLVHNSLKSALPNPNFAPLLRKQETFDAILNAVPALEQDPIAATILQDIDMIRFVSHTDNYERVMKEHPVLKDALQVLFGLLRQEPATSSGVPPQSLSPPVSYSLDSLSDDDMEDQGVAMSGPITSAHLATALAHAAASTPAAAAANQGITPSMFSQAMQSAMASSSATLSSQAPAASRLAAQLQQMREMGITEDAVSLQALEATGGDVNAAVELLFGIESGSPPSSS